MVSAQADVCSTDLQQQLYFFNLLLAPHGENQVSIINSVEKRKRWSIQKPFFMIKWLRDKQKLHFKQ